MAVHWGQPVLCDSCLNNVVSPLETTVFTVFLTDQFGCVAEDAVTVFVEERARIFIPNVFSPNGDQVNDEVRIAVHAGVEEIQRFSIYDRWGNLVYHREDFQPQDASVFWDGTFEGEMLNPAVFVYLIETRLLTGRTEIFSGTLTLIR
jgi:gliding motility-associated-like protein